MQAKELEQLQMLTEQETEDNDELQARCLGNPIKFGQTVQLMHVSFLLGLRFASFSLSSSPSSFPL